jgi:hypothetical protein
VADFGGRLRCAQCIQTEAARKTSGAGTRWTARAVRGIRPVAAFVFALSASWIFYYSAALILGLVSRAFNR